MYGCCLIFKTSFYSTSPLYFRCQRRLVCVLRLFFYISVFLLFYKMKVAKKKNEVNTIDQATDFNVTGFVFSAFSHFIIEN